MKRTLLLVSVVSICLSARAAYAQDEETAQPAQAAPPPAAAAAQPAANEAPIAKEDPKKPRRQGFTIELGLGASFMSVDSVKNVESNKIGLAPLSLGLGAFISRDVAITFRMTGASLFQDRGGKTEQVVLGFYGAALQYFVSEQVYVGAGLGLGLVAANPFMSLEPSRNEPIKPRAGFAGLARLGWNFYQDKSNAVSLMSEVVPAWVGDANAVGVTFALGYQHH